jgi:hypothetical protein
MADISGEYIVNLEPCCGTPTAATLTQLELPFTVRIILNLYSIMKVVNDNGSWLPCAYSI